MAYDPNKDKNPNENPYESVVGGSIGAQSLKASSATGVSGTFQAERPSGEALPGAGGPSAGGHVNFDQIYNANAGTSAREAKKMQNNALKSGEQARTGIAGAQEQFGQAVRTGTVAGPTDAQSNAAKHGKTGVEWGKQVMSATMPVQGKTADKKPQGSQPNEQPGAKQWDTQDEGDLRAYIAMHGEDFEGNKITLDEYNAKKRAENGGATPNAPHSGSTVTEQGVGLDGSAGMEIDPVTGKWRNVAGAPMPGSPEAAAGPTPEEIRAQLAAGAGQEYGGPGSLSELDGYEQLLRDAGAAQDEAQAFGMGNAGFQGLGLNALDAALVGASGRKGFEQLSQRYGSLKSDLDAANTASVGTANAARSQSEEAAKAYQDLLDGLEGRTDEEQAFEDARSKRSDGAMSAAQKKHDTQKAYDEAMSKSSEGLEGFRNEMHGFAGALSPSHWLFRGLGEKSPLDAATGWFGQQFLGDQAGGFNAGSRSEAWGKDDADVFGSMSEADWVEFNSMSLDDQKAWIAARKAKLQGGG